MLDLGVPRFVLEEHNEPGQSRRAWDRQRYYSPDEKTILDCLGPYPEDGYYTYFWTVCRHEGGGLDNGPCCERLWTVARQRCWGLYREPAEIDLLRVRKAWRLQLEHRREHPGEELPPNVLVEARRASFESHEQWKQNLKDSTGEMIDDFMKTHSFSFTTDDPSVHRWGRFHFMSGHKKSGSPVILTDK